MLWEEGGEPGARARETAQAEPATQEGPRSRWRGTRPWPGPEAGTVGVRDRKDGWKSPCQRVPSGGEGGFPWRRTPGPGDSFSFPDGPDLWVILPRSQKQD